MVSRDSGSRAAKYKLHVQFPSNSVNVNSKKHHLIPDLVFLQIPLSSRIDIFLGYMGPRKNNPTVTRMVCMVVPSDVVPSEPKDHKDIQPDIRKAGRTLLCLTLL